MAKVEKKIVQNPYADQISKPSSELNRLEHYLLKPVIPFLRIGHCTRGRYLRLQGQLIMISADVVTSMEKVLPVPQNLIPVSFKRKKEYKGYYIREYIDRQKVEEYFHFLKSKNHLFEEYELTNLEKVEDEMSKAIDEDEDETDSDEDEEPSLETDVIPMGQSSLIQDKYQESTQAPTVGNKMASMIHDFERFREISEKDEDVEDPVNDPEDEFFPEDEKSDYEQENSFLEKLQAIDVKLEDKDNLTTISKLEEIFQTWRRKPRLHLAEHFCYLVKKDADLVIQKDQLLRMKSNIVELQSLIDSALLEVNASIEETTKKCSSTIKCYHNDDVPEARKLLDNILKLNADSSEKTQQFVSNQVKQIEKNLGQIISVAPGEAGQFKNWGSDIYLEEKLFPQLFPFGIGGYLSSNMLRSSNMGFSNYCRNRLLSVQPKFRRDKDYIFFLLIIKEVLEMKRSERTFFRKAAKLPALTPAVLSEQPPEFFKRYNSSFTTFKNVRGTAFYYQDVKKRLMAFLRQKGGPTLFATFSAAEFAWDDLALRIYETVTKEPSTLEFIKSQSVSWRNKLIQENVVQSTIHFNKRMDKIISFLNNNPLLEHDGVQYSVKSYFYRIEFQVISNYYC